MSGNAIVLQGNALHLPLPDESVDLVVTSPPYFALRSYQDEGKHYDGQVGSEATPQDFIDALLRATDEMVRVLKPSGSIWINLGDKYAGSGGHNNNGLGGSTLGHHKGGGGPHVERIQKVEATRRNAPDRYNQNAGGIRAKSLMGLPWRYAIGCIDQLDLILRAEIVWCLSGGVKVYARINGRDRPLMLRDLVRHYQPEQVQLWNGERWTQVRGWNRTPDDDGALEIELRTGERIGCTPGHKWPTDRGVLRADEIRVADVISTIRLPSPDEPRTPALLPDDDIGWLIGLYIAEGSRSERMVQISGHIDETLRHSRLARIASALDGECNVYQTSENGSTCNLSGSAILGVIDRYVSPGTAKSKRLQFTAWQRSDLFLAAVLDGYLSGDGHYDAKNDRWRLGFTANDEWASDLRTIAARLDLPIRLRRASHVMAGRAFPGWRGEVRYTRSTHHNAKRDGEVVAIRRSRARDFYDLGVADEPHLFALASGVLTHNSKPNGLPESVADRVRRSHEQWFMFTKEPRYFSAVDEIREPHADRRDLKGTKDRSDYQWQRDVSGLTRQWEPEGERVYNPLGKLPGSVWTIPTEPLIIPEWAKEKYGLPDHFAAFPQEWPRRIILGWSPSGICVECGEGRRPVVDKSQDAEGRTTNGPKSLARRHEAGGTNGAGRAIRTVEQATITSYACACPEPTADTTPAVVLDPFSGTGTTAMVARALGRVGIGIDLSHDYTKLARWRIEESGHGMKTIQRTAKERQGAML